MDKDYPSSVQGREIWSYTEKLELCSLSQKLQIVSKAILALEC